MQWSLDIQSFAYWEELKLFDEPGQNQEGPSEKNPFLDVDASAGMHQILSK